MASDQVRAFGRECLRMASECRAKNWPPEHEDSYLSVAAEIADASDLQIELEARDGK